MAEKQISESTFLAAIAEGQKIRPCGFDVAKFLASEVDANGFTSKFLTADVKSLWAHAYWTANGIDAHIENDDVTFQPVGDRMLVVAKCRIVVGVEVIASASAGKSFSLTNSDDLTIDTAVQSATGVALGRALSNAGFGAVWKMATPSEWGASQQANPDPLANPYAPAAGGVHAPANGFRKSFATPANVPSVANGSGDASAPALVTEQGTTAEKNDSDLPFVTGGNSVSDQPDEKPQPSTTPANANIPQTVEEAKAVIYPYKSAYGFQGLTMGEILATNPKQIIQMAGSSRDEAIRAAAKLLLPDAKAMCGK